MYCYVAVSDLTSVVEERCHGGQTYWDVHLCQFFLDGIWYSALGKGFQLSGIFFFFLHLIWFLVL